jgi:hypothetical protein
MMLALNQVMRAAWVLAYSNAQMYAVEAHKHALACTKKESKVHEWMRLTLELGEDVRVIALRGGSRVSRPPGLENA